VLYQNSAKGGGGPQAGIVIMKYLRASAGE
jgi:hypothetical protein